MENRQPDMDALSKAEKSHKDKGGKSSNDLDKKIRSLHKRWQKLGMKMHERHRLLKEAKDRCNDMEKMKSFDFETWRKKFNGWVDKNKLRPRELLHRSDGNRDGHLTKDELMKALKASGVCVFVCVCVCVCVCVFVCVCVCVCVCVYIVHISAYMYGTFLNKVNDVALSVE